MRKIQTLIYICIVLSVINVLVIIFLDKKIIKLNETRTTSVSPIAEAPVSDIYVPKEMELAGEKVPLHRQDVFEAVQKELIVNTYLHSHTIQILKKASRVFSVIEPILKENGIPDDFKYLAVIESRLEPLIVSPAGATGIWQLMKKTAQELGLEVDNDIDERYHLEKATQAAAAYLKKAYEKFGSWTLAAASYNAGSAMLSKQMDIQKETDYYNLLLGEETERYVFRILALKQILNEPEKYNFIVNTDYPAEEIIKIKIDYPVKDWADFAQAQGITYKTLKRFNPWLRKNSLRNPHHKTYEISIPVNKELYK